MNTHLYVVVVVQSQDAEHLAMAFLQAPAPMPLQVGVIVGQLQSGQSLPQSPTVLVTGGEAVGQPIFGILPDGQFGPPGASTVGFGQLQVQVFAQFVSVSVSPVHVAVAVLLIAARTIMMALKCIVDYAPWEEGEGLRDNIVQF